MDLIISIIAGVIALGVLILLHEAGHYAVARLSGMSVRRFSIGFGPPVLGFVRGGTLFQIGAVPFGGYVQIDGMNPADGTDPAAPGSYLSKPFFHRFMTILAGPLANFIIGLVLFSAFFAFFNIEALAPVRVVRVSPGSPAEAAGLRPGDLLVGTSSATFMRSSDLLDAIRGSHGAPLRLVVAPPEASSAGDRSATPGPEPGEARATATASVAGQRTVTLRPMPVAGGGYRIGIELEPTRTRRNPLGLGPGIRAAVDEFGKVTGSFVALITAPFQRGKSAGGEVTGPIGLVGAIAARLRSSWAEALALVAQISLGLGLANLLPLPALDGSRLALLLVSAVRRRELSPKVESVVHTVGFLLMLALLALLSIRDVHTMIGRP